MALHARDWAYVNKRLQLTPRSQSDQDLGDADRRRNRTPNYMRPPGSVRRRAGAADQVSARGISSPDAAAIGMVIGTMIGQGFVSASGS
jgi:hypothetical protein